MVALVLTSYRVMQITTLTFGQAEFPNDIANLFVLSLIVARRTC